MLAVTWNNHGMSDEPAPEPDAEPEPDAAPEPQTEGEGDDAPVDIDAGYPPGEYPETGTFGYATEEAPAEPEPAPVE